MNKFFLTFKSQELESEYQASQMQHMRYKLYLGMVYGCLLMNLFIVISYFVSQATIIWQINAGFALFSLIQIFVFQVMKHLKYLQTAMTITNILIGLLELTLDPETVTKTEYFAYGNTFMQFQAIIYILSDFHYSIIQVICQLIARQVITQTASNEFNLLLFGTQIIAVVLVAIATHMRNKSGRIFYMQSLKDTYFEQISSFFIIEPYFKITLKVDDMMFHVTQNQKIYKFPGYDEDLCSGCNVRKFLRQYTFETGLSLEQQLLQLQIEKLSINQDQLDLPATIPIFFQKKKYLLRIAKTDFVEISYLIILEQDQQRDLNNENKEEEKELKGFLQQNKSPHQRFMAWGILQVILLKSQVLKKVDMIFILEKFLRIYQRKIWDKFKIIIICEKDQSFHTFLHQLQIFLIQLFDSIMLMQHQKKGHTRIRIESDIKYFYMNVENDFSNTIMNNLYSNYFFRKTSQLLVQKTIIKSDSIQFQFKKYSKKAFLCSKM